jgi:hypothetical protein
LDVPVGLFEGWNNTRFSFHDTKLSSVIDHAVQALAIDEKRGPFRAALWAFPDHKNYSSVEQVWFPGVHSNVGGGYENRGLSDISLRWMLDRIAAKGLELKLYDRPPITGDPDGKLYDSRTAWYALSRVRPTIRIINQARPRDSKGGQIVGLPRNANPIGEMLHWSALHRWNTSPLYRPINIEATFPTIFGGDARFITHVVGLDNEPLNWIDRQDHFEWLKSTLPTKFAKKLGSERQRRLDAIAAAAVPGEEDASAIDRCNEHN